MAKEMPQAQELDTGSDQTTRSVSEKINAFLGQISDYFFRLNIVRKLLLGYLPLCIFLALFTFLGLMSLTTLNQLNSAIIETDIPLINLAEQMKDDVLAQELYAKRYAILKAAETLEMFRQRQEDFQQRIRSITALPEKRDLPVSQLLEDQHSYHRFLRDHFIKPGKNLADKNSLDQLLRVRQELLMDHIPQIKEIASQDQLDKTMMSVAMGKKASTVAVMLCWVGLVISLLAVFVVTRNIAGTIRKLQRATEEIATGNFDYDPDVKNTDELGDLAQAFQRRGNCLKIL